MHKDIQSQKQAWVTYDRLMESENVAFLTEPDAAQLEFTLRRLSSSALASSQQWPDAYLAAFANTSALTLVTFDRALSRSAPGTVLLLSYPQQLAPNQRAPYILILEERCRLVHDFAQSPFPSAVARHHVPSHSLL